MYIYKRNEVCNAMRGAGEQCYFKNGIPYSLKVHTSLYIKFNLIYIFFPFSSFSFSVRHSINRWQFFLLRLGICNSFFTALQRLSSGFYLELALVFFFFLSYVSSPVFHLYGGCNREQFRLLLCCPMYNLFCTLQSTFAQTDRIFSNFCADE